MKTKQTHLNKTQTINLGSFYTPDFIVDLAYKMLNNNINLEKNFVLLDSSCGYGNFLKSKINFRRKIGIDIDQKAINYAMMNYKNDENPPIFLHKNSLFDINRANFGIKDEENLIIIGNPPYNDKSSIIQNKLKKEYFKIDEDIKARDLGFSFLLSFNKLKADFVCILHPLSYLIKENNFKILRAFFKNYKLLDSLVISSEIFCPNSMSYFPIIIALYKKDNYGIDYNYIKNYQFKTIENKIFCLNDFVFINQFVTKYPNKKQVLNNQKIAMFYTLRDINALRRSKTFIEKDCDNAIYITAEKYSLYCYIDVFKQILPKLPYYFGNLDVMIDYNNFKNLEDKFVIASKTKQLNPDIMDYFNNLLGKHYANS